jgi:hypothetical protein
MAKYRIAALATAYLAVAGAICTLIAGADPIVAGRTIAGRSVARSVQSPGHLYVLDGSAVYRFPLAQDGLPATQPDGVLYPELTSGFYSLAVDKIGHVFVADIDQGIVAEFAAGATGHRFPISILYVDAPARLALDDAERLYVYCDAFQEQNIAIFARGAHGHDTPISIVAKYGFEVDYVIAKNGVLSVLNDSYAVAVYNHPLNNPSQPDRLIIPDGNFFEFNSTLALDEATGKLYIQFGPDGQYWDKVDYDVRPTVPSAQKPWIFTGDCGSANYVFVFGTVIVKSYLIVSCASNGDVLVYRKDQFGRQRAPVEIVGEGILGFPRQMAVGP